MPCRIKLESPTTPIAAREQPDLMIVKGNPALKITDMKKSKSSSKTALSMTLKVNPVGAGTGGDSVKDLWFVNQFNNQPKKLRNFFYIMRQSLHDTL